MLRKILGVVFKRPKDIIWCATFVIKISKSFGLEGFSHINEMESGTREEVNSRSGSAVSW